MNFTTSARVRAILEAGGSSQEGLATAIAGLIPAVSAAMERELDRYATAEERTEVLDVDFGQRVFRLRGWPVTSIASVKHDTDREFGSASAIASTEYAANLAMGRLTLDLPVTPGDGVLQVVYTGGMVATGADFAAAFPELAHLADLQIAYLLQRKEGLGASSQSVGGGSVAYQGAYDWLPIVRQGLARMRRWGT